jgi:peptidoglycan/LPS O-acetylase OafA/YrhL
VGSRHRIPTLDGWRAVAIGAVILSHAFQLSGAASRPVRAAGYIMGHLGGLGVALFFAISGYLITTLLLEEAERRSGISLRGFYVRRAFRILPAAYLYLIVLAIAGGCGWLGDSLRRGELASAAFFYSNYWPERSWYTAQFWSLSMEEHFYLLWPALLAGLGARRALIAAGAFLAAAAVWRPWSLAHISLPYPALQRTDMRLDAFLYAGALAILLHGPYRLPVLRALTAPWFRACSVLAVMAAWVWMLAGSARSAGTLVESALLPAILVSVIYWPGSRLFRILEWPPLLWVGRISYGMYLWQQFFFTPLRAVTISAAAEVFLPRLVLTFAAAIVSCYLLERPLLSYSRMVSTRFQSAPLVEVLDNNDMADSDLSAVLVMHKTADKFKKDSD